MPSEGLPLLVFGTVVDTKDPDGLGRVQVKLTGFEKDVTLPWLRQLNAYASNAFGVVLLPEKDDEVAILRGADNHPDGMLIIGCVYNGKNKPKVTDGDGKNNVKELRTRSGHAITISDESGKESITVATGDGKLSIAIDQKGGSITVTGDKEIAIKANTKVVVEGNEIAITGKSKVAITGNSQVAIEGKSAVEVKSSSSVKIQGGMVQISGTMVEIG